MNTMQSGILIMSAVICAVAGAIGHQQLCARICLVFSGSSKILTVIGPMIALYCNLTSTWEVTSSYSLRNPSILEQQLKNVGLSCVGNGVAAKCGSTMGISGWLYYLGGIKR